MDFTQRFKAARSVSTPIVAVTTNDQTATVRTLTALLTPKKGQAGQASPLLEWDLIRGIIPINDLGKDALTEALIRMGSKDEGPLDQKATTNPVTCLEAADMLPTKSVLFLYNAHNYVTGEDTRRSDGTIAFSQALCNLRNTNKANQRMTVLLGPDFSLPLELKPDVYLLDEPLPTPEGLREVLDNTVTNWNNRKAIVEKREPAVVIPDDVMVQSIDALRGIESGYAAEQAAALSMSAKGFDVGELWERKRQLINATPGLKVYLGKDTFADVEGYDVAKDFFRLVLNGQNKFRTVVFLDEIEKMFGNSGFDTSGVTTEMLGMILTEMQDMEYTGAIFLGPAGSGKTALAKAIGGELRQPFIYQDIAGAKGGIVGTSTANLRRHFKIIKAVSDGAALFIATCNSITQLPPPLRARFGLGTFFIDLPTAAERAKIWALWMRKFDLPEQPTPKDARWVGRDIQHCCRLAWSLKITILAASAYIVPMAVAAKDEVEKLRMSASGKYLSASTPGNYHYVADLPEKKMPVASDGRTFSEE